MTSSALDDALDNEMASFLKEAQEKLSGREKLVKELQVKPLEKSRVDQTQQENENPTSVVNELNTTTNSDDSAIFGIHTFGKKLTTPSTPIVENNQTPTQPQKLPTTPSNTAERTLNSSNGDSAKKTNNTPKKLVLSKYVQEPIVERKTSNTRASSQEPSPKRAFKGYKRFESEPNPIVEKPTVKTVNFKCEEEPVAMTKVPTPVKSSDIEGRPEAEMTSDEPQSKSPETSFRVEERPSSAADCLTPSRARLMDEINEVYEVHARSLPRHTKIITKNSSANLLSLKEYRREMMEKSVPNASTVESVLIPTDECDSSSNQNPTDVDKKKQIQNLVSIYSAQHDQAQKALRYTMDKMDRDEEEFIEANHVLLTHRVALEAARRMQNSLEKNASKNVPRMKSAFTFNSVTFELDAEFLHEICLDGSSCFFTVVISHNETSRCSPYTSYRANNKRRLTVEIYSILNDVKPDFEIYVEVYMLKINKNNSEKRNAFAEVVGTLLRNDRHGVRRQEYRTSEPRFERVGVAVINSSNMRSRYISAETVQYVAPRFEVNFEHQLVESDYFVEGYLRRFELLAGVGNWSMEYMSFKNWFLESWITHREKQEGKPSIRSVNLRRCLDVSEVEDSASYPFSFMLTYSTEVNKTEKMTLAARSKEEYDQWFKLFNEFVSGLRYWS